MTASERKVCDRETDQSRNSDALPLYSTIRAESRFCLNVM